MGCLIVKLTLDFDKMNFMKLRTNNKTCVLLIIRYGGKTIEEVERNKFFGVQIDSNISWKPNLPLFAITPVTLLGK
jgi:hypothetical protein